MSPAASVLLDHAVVSAADRAIINRANSQHSTGPAPPPKPPWSSTSLASQEAIDQISKLGLYTSRLSRQFQNTVKQLREIQGERRLEERRQLRAAADLLVQHERKQIPWDPADDGFVFSALRQNPTRSAFQAAFLKATNSVLVAASRCALSNR
jgi:hypothetical protein